MVSQTCIYCGQCLKSCPQGAIKVESGFNRVKKAINEGKKVVASIAPSFIGSFEMKEPGQIVAALKKLGINIVEETAIGAEIIEESYRKYVSNNPKKNIITTSCPSANLLIEIYYPSLIEYMIPLVSPMIAHGKILKKTYGNDSFVVFIGPCISKSFEANDFQDKGVIDAVLTFEEISSWLKEENIKLNTLEKEAFDKKSYKEGSSFPLNGSIVQNMFKNKNDNKYQLINATGIEDCKLILDSIENEKLENLCLELNICKGGCLGGPGIPKDAGCHFIREKKIKDYVSKKVNFEKKNFDNLLKDLKLTKKFFDKSIEKPLATENEIEEILNKMGKRSVDDELNCGSCGFNTCREKAQAVFEGKAELSMCLPFMRNKAESLANIIFQYTPNAIFVLDEQLKVIEINPAAENLFNTKLTSIKEKPISILMEDSDFLDVLVNKINIMGKKIVYKEYGLTLLESVLYISDQNVLLVIMSNITMEEKHREELKKVKGNAVLAAQNVIEKQMRVAQEIASLLGETTAETKSTLTKLKEIALNEDGDLK